MAKKNRLATPCKDVISCALLEVKECMYVYMYTQHSTIVTIKSAYKLKSAITNLVETQPLFHLSSQPFESVI